MIRPRTACLAFVAAFVPLSLVQLLSTPALDGPVPIAWDREQCAECRMHIGDPRFAAQLQTEQADVLNFDDPGCALRYLAREAPRVHALYFHDHEEDTCLPSDRAAFVRVSPSPMGYDLAAAKQGTTGTLSLAEASQHAQAPQ